MRFVFVVKTVGGKAMTHIWIKLTNIENKILKDITMPLPNGFREQDLLEHLANLCHELDVATPMILSKHKTSLQEYGQITFLQTDFVEPVNFHKMVFQVYDLK